MAEDGPAAIRWEASGLMGVGYGQYRLETGAEVSDEWPDSEDGLTLGEAGWAVVLTGTEWGSIDLSLQLLDATPATTDEPPWDMVIERDLSIPRQREIQPGTPAGGRPYQISITDIRTGDIPYGIPAAPGLYRIRISVANRARDAHPAGPNAAETHLIQVWPATGASGPQTLHGPDSYSRARLIEQGRPGSAHPSPTSTEVRAGAPAVAAIHDVLTAVRTPETFPTQTPAADTPLHLSRVIAAPPQDVYAMALKFDFWLGWGGILDMTVGGRFTTWILPVESPEGSLFATGRIRDLAEDDRIAFSWQWGNDGDRVPVLPAEISIALMGHPSSTTANLVVQGLPHERMPALVDLWTYYLDRLAALSEGSSTGPHPWLP